MIKGLTHIYKSDSVDIWSIARFTYFISGNKDKCKTDYPDVLKKNQPNLIIQWCDKKSYLIERKLFVCISKHQTSKKKKPMSICKQGSRVNLNTKHSSLSDSRALFSIFNAGSHTTLQHDSSWEAGGGGDPYRKETCPQTMAWSIFRAPER